MILLSLTPHSGPLAPVPKYAGAKTSARRFSVVGVAFSIGRRSSGMMRPAFTLHHADAPGKVVERFGSPILDVKSHLYKEIGQIFKAVVLP